MYDYHEIMAEVRSRIIGQERAMGEIEQALMLAQAGIGAPDKPLAVLFFAGPTGVGKSETVVALARALGSEICRVDCNLLTESHTIASLTGSPPGYVGSTEGNSLLIKEKIEGKPGHPGIVVFEEIEKAHPVIMDALLGIFDKAMINMTHGKGSISFSNTIVICTSNIGSRELKDEVSGCRLGFALSDPVKTEKLSKQDFNLDGDARKSIVQKSMEKQFRPEFLGRVDYTVIFRWLTPAELIVILDTFIDQLNIRLMGRGLYLEVTSPAKEFLVEKGFDIKYGARPLKTAVRKYLEVPLSADICSASKQGVKYTAHKSGEGLAFYKTDLPMLVAEVKEVKEVKDLAPTTTMHAVKVPFRDETREWRLPLTGEESVTLTRWLPVLCSEDVFLLLDTIDDEHFLKAIQLLGELTAKLKAARFVPDIDQMIQCVATSVLCATGMMRPETYWGLLDGMLP